MLCTVVLQINIIGIKRALKWKGGSRKWWKLGTNIKGSGLSLQGTVARGGRNWG